MFSQVKSDLLCNIFASMTASEETFPITKNVSKDDPCNWSRHQKQKEIYHYKQTKQQGHSTLKCYIYLNVLDWLYFTTGHKLHLFDEY